MLLVGFTFGCKSNPNRPPVVQSPFGSVSAVSVEPQSKHPTMQSDGSPKIKLASFQDNVSGLTNARNSIDKQDGGGGIVEVVAPVQAGETKSQTTEQSNKVQFESENQSAREVNLNELILASMYTHPFIRAEIEKVSQARGDYWTSTLKPNPELSSSFTLIPLDQPFTVDRQGGPPQFDIGIEYPIDWYLFGKRTAAMSVAHFGVHVSQSELENAIRLRVLDAANNYFNALEAAQLRDIAERNVENLNRLRDVTALAIKNGGRPAIEGKRIALDLLTAEQDLRTAKANERAQLANLGALLGVRSIEELPRPEGWPLQRLLESTPRIEEALFTAEQARPDLASLRWQIAQAGADVNYQTRLGKPTVAPSVGYTRQYQEKAIGFPDADSWGAGLAVSLPIHDRNQGNVFKAGAVQRTAQMQLQASLLELDAEIKGVIAELDAAIANLKSIENEQIELANEVLESIEIAYQNGGRPLIDVLDAQRNFREINSRAVSARAAYWRAVYRYFAAIGQESSSTMIGTADSGVAQSMAEMAVIGN